MRPSRSSLRWWFIRNPTVPSFMPYTGLPRPPWRCRVCSMKPSPPSATSTSAASGACSPYRATSLRVRALRLFGGTGEEGEAWRRGHRRLRCDELSITAPSCDCRAIGTRARTQEAGIRSALPIAADWAVRSALPRSAARSQLRQPLHRHRRRRVVQRLLRCQLVEHRQREAQRGVVAVQPCA